MIISRVLILEDLKLSLEWLSQAALQAFPNATQDHAMTLQGGLNFAKNNTYDLALIDIGLPDGSGLDLVELLTQKFPKTHVVVTTIFDDDAHVFSALRKGAKGYVLKDQDKDQLAQMFSKIESGQLPISAAIASKLLNYFSPKIQENPLSPRETEVLTILAKGYKVPEVSEFLDIKKSTCYGYVKEIYKKLNINSRAEATLKANKMGLVNID